MLRKRRNQKEEEDSSVENTKKNVTESTTASPAEDESQPLVVASEKDDKTSGGGDGREEEDVRKQIGQQQQQQLPQYYIAKWAILRLMGIMYWFAFAAAYWQNDGLMGSHGLQPAQEFVKRLHEHFDDNNKWQGFSEFPTIFWWISLSDDNMNYVNLAGVCLATVVVCGNINSWIIQFLLWILYFSTVTIASGSTSFYSYGWESQILETGFLCIFLCELPHYYFRRRNNNNNIEGGGGFGFFRLALYEGKFTAPTGTILWLFQWLIFRISTGAGLIKVRGSSCWTDKTCLYYHFETQPIPSPLSFAYHFAPKTMQRQMVHTDLMVQLYTAWFVLFPSCTALWFHPRLERCVRFIVRLGGFLQAGFMVGILLSGNFSVLNHLTIIPALACLDDKCWPDFLQRRLIRATEKRHVGNGNETDGTNTHKTSTAVPMSRRVVDVLLLCLILSLSRPVIDNLLQRGDKRMQLMNASFDSFRLVNTYGAFGSVGKERYEVIIQLSDDGETWYELEFPCKPGNVYRRPNIWFIGFKPHQNYLRQRETWMYNLLKKILEPDEGGVARKRPWLDLLDFTSREYLSTTYYNNHTAPMYAKVDMYRYRMAAPLWSIVWEQLNSGSAAWWTRGYEEALIPQITLQSFRNV